MYTLPPAPSIGFGVNMRMPGFSFAVKGRSSIAYADGLRAVGLDRAEHAGVESAVGADEPLGVDVRRDPASRAAQFGFGDIAFGIRAQAILQAAQQRLVDRPIECEAGDSEERREDDARREQRARLQGERAATATTHCSTAFGSGVLDSLRGIAKR
jgi:hypothetical protein